MTTLQILIFRHGEKPGDPATDLPTDGLDLSIRGFARAAALAHLIPAPFNNPDYLFAAQQSKHSNRPVETITPLSQRLGIPIDSDYADHDYADLAGTLLAPGQFEGKTLVICWHHGKIPELASALGVQHPPAPWPDDLFDGFWKVTISNGDATLSTFPQRVLFGDHSD